MSIFINAEDLKLPRGWTVFQTFGTFTESCIIISTSGVWTIVHGPWWESASDSDIAKLTSALLQADADYHVGQLFVPEVGIRLGLGRLPRSGEFLYDAFATAMGDGWGRMERLSGTTAYFRENGFWVQATPAELAILHGGGGVNAAYQINKAAAGSTGLHLLDYDGGLVVGVRKP